MPFLLSDEYQAGIYSQDHWDAVGGEDSYFADPIGTGPFTHVELKLNQYILHKRVENHWRKTPEFREVQFLFAPEAATRLAMLLAGEAHIATVPRGLQSQATSAGMKIGKSTLPGSHYFAWIPWYRPDNYVDPNIGKPLPGLPAVGPTKAYDPADPIRNVKVRQALNEAINRNEINQVFLGEAPFRM